LLSSNLHNRPRRYDHLDRIDSRFRLFRSTTFTDKRITLIDTATTENYYEFGDFGGPIGFAFCCADSATATVEGIGTFGSAATTVDTEFSDSGVAIDDSANRLSIASGLDVPNTAESIGPVFGNGGVIDACDPDFQFAPCPGYIETTGGDLIINSFNPDSAIGQETLSAVPEPGTFVLIGSGLLAMSGVWRKRFI
jgi:hypothetical protein